MADVKKRAPVTGRDLIVALVVLALALVFYLAFSRPKAVGATLVRVYVGSGGEPYEQAPLGEDRTISVDQGDGRVNRVEIKDGGVSMAYSSCKNQDCVHEGVVTDESRKRRAMGDWIVCLPNGVAIELAEGE